MTETLPPRSAPARRRPPARRTAVGLIALAVVTIGFLALELPAYLTLDPARSRIVPRTDYPLHYPLLWAHIMFGSIALITACLQIWPWLRRRHPTVHRWSGRVYLCGGVLPGGIAVLGVAPVSSTNPAMIASSNLKRGPTPLPVDYDMGWSPGCRARRRT